jgi:hypothetical protein
MIENYFSFLPYSPGIFPSAEFLPFSVEVSINLELDLLTKWREKDNPLPLQTILPSPILGHFLIWLEGEFALLMNTYCIRHV